MLVRHSLFLFKKKKDQSDASSSQQQTCSPRTERLAALSKTKRDIYFANAFRFVPKR
jgi:hypothetical protein